MTQITNWQNYYINKCIIKTRSNDKLEEIDNKNRTCYYINDIIKIEDFDLDNVLTGKELYENILVYNISYKSLIDSRPLRIRSDEIDEFIRAYDETSNLVFSGSENYDSTYDRIKHLISVKSGISWLISHNYATIKVNSYDFLPLEKTMTFRNVILLVKSVWNKENYLKNKKNKK